MINIGAEDYNVLKQQYIKKYIRLELLDFQYNIVDELSGNMTKCSINVDSNSDLRRSCDLGFVVTTSTFDIKAGSKIFLDRMVRPYVGYENMRTGEIQWYNQGIYLVNNPQWSYNASTNEISMQALDLMSKLTGLRNGNLEGIPTKIAKDENVRDAIIKTIELGGFTKYICEECKTKDGTIVPVPYDIEIDVGGTIYDILTGLRDIMPNYQIYFDINGVFHYEPIPLAYDDPVLIDDDLFNNVLISENINTDFESVKNYVEVLGHTWDVDYYSPSESTTVSGGTITPTFADLTALEDGTAVGITLPSDVEIGEPVTPVLPEGYTELEYIENSGTQYINTGFKPNQNTRVVLKVSGAPRTKEQVLFGARTNMNTATDNFMFLATGSQDYRTDFYNSKVSIPTSFDFSGKYTIDKNKEKTYLDGVLAATNTIGTFSCNYPIFLFTGNTGGTAGTPKSGTAIYYCKIYDNNVLVRDFIPCKNPSGTIGLYDTVNSQFYKNSGTDTFIAGPEIIQPSSDFITINYKGSYNVVDINNSAVKSLSKDTEWIFQFVPGPKLPSGYTELEYIQSSGTQYIDTQFTVSSSNYNKIKFIVDCDIIGKGSGASDWLINGSNINNAYFYVGQYQNKYYYGCGTTDHNTNTSVVSGRNIFTLDTKNKKFSVSDILEINATIEAITETANLYLCGFAYTAQRTFAQKLYNSKIYQDDVLIRDFIPCKNSSGAIGLYDTVNSQFYSNAGTGTFIAGPEIPSTEDKGGPFWRFMGHQQAQATSYDNNPSSPFYVGDPIGSSSVGRIRIVLYGGEYDNIYSDDLAQQRADFEIYQRSRLNDSISMETIPIPWMDANIVVSHRFGQKQEPSKYIVKSFSVDYATGGTMTINAITWYPYYEESEVI
nr:MAG TPA: protein of unknown function DUF5047 [Caudoviricetes sp.]